MSLLKNKMIYKYGIYGVVCLAVFLAWYSILYFQDIGNSENQKKIFSRLTHLNTKEITSVELQFVKESKLMEQKCYLANSDLHEFLSFFDDADFMQVGGHNRRVYECIIILKHKNGGGDRFVGTVYSDYEFNKDALYIYKYFYEQENGYYIAKENGLPVRVTKLGKWIMDKCPFGKL